MSFSFYRQIRTRRRRARGFTLMELLVVTGIVVIISAIMLANHAAFGGSITLRNLAYDIALSLREAQTYGISVRQFQGDFSAGYGVHIRLSSPTEYILFADGVTQNSVYDAGELVRSASIAGGFHIADVCIVPAGQSSELCAGDGVTQVDITFVRPEPDAHIRYNGTTAAQSARIVLQSPRGDQKNVIVETAGQISVQ